jgi:hypothetical protein
LWPQHTSNGCSLDADNKLIYVTEGYLNAMQQNFSDYAEKNVEDMDWVRVPFYVVPLFYLKTEEEITDLNTGKPLKLKVPKPSLAKFWLALKKEFPAISETGVRILLLSSTTYLCAQWFFDANENKALEEGETRTVDKEMRFALSIVSSFISLLCLTKQAQILHCNSRKDIEYLAY